MDWCLLVSGFSDGDTAAQQQEHLATQAASEYNSHIVNFNTNIKTPHSFRRIM